MRSLNREENPNTCEHWDVLYQGGHRCGWWNDGLAPFLQNEIALMSVTGRQNFIEIGGGTGLSASIIKSQFPELNCYNVDLSAKAIECGKELYPDINQICHDVHYSFDTSFNYFDILLCQEVIEHLENPPLGIQNMMKLVAEGGLVCFTFPYAEGEQDGFLHLWSFDYSELRDLFFPYTNEIIVCKLVPFSKFPNLWGCIKFYKS